MSATERTCVGCGTELPSPARGRPRKWCSETCRQHTLYSGACVDCGAPTYNGTVPPPERCHDCNAPLFAQRAREEAREHREAVEAAWAEGLTCREMAARFGWSQKQYVCQLRKRGYNLPHRRTPEQVKRIGDGWAETRKAAA